MWEQISSNRRRSVALTIGIGAILLLVGYLIGLYFFGNGYAGLVIALIIWGIMNLVALFQGDSILLSISKAKKIKKSDHPRLYNIVEEMQIASGLEKMPDIYIIDDPALNAFATGRDPKRASVAITSGLLNKLNRDELQGVIGHEMAHIKNRDVLLMVMCGILLGSIVMLSWVASRALLFGGARRSRTSSSSGGGGGIILIVAIVLMIIAPLAAHGRRYPRHLLGRRGAPAHLVARSGGRSGAGRHHDRRRCPHDPRADIGAAHLLRHLT